MTFTKLSHKYSRIKHVTFWRFKAFTRRGPVTKTEVICRKTYYLILRFQLFWAAKTCFGHEDELLIRRLTTSIV